jgi:hypothetical protein
MEIILFFIYSVGDSSWPCNPDNVIVSIFPDDDIPAVMAFGSVFSFLHDKNPTLRLPSNLAKRYNPQFIRILFIIS